MRLGRARGVDGLFSTEAFNADSLSRDPACFEEPSHRLSPTVAQFEVPCVRPGLIGMTPCQELPTWRSADSVQHRLQHEPVSAVQFRFASCEEDVGNNRGRRSRVNVPQRLGRRAVRSFVPVPFCVGEDMILRRVDFGRCKDARAKPRVEYDDVADGETCHHDGHRTPSHPLALALSNRSASYRVGPLGLSVVHAPVDSCHRAHNRRELCYPQRESADAKQSGCHVVQRRRVSSGCAAKVVPTFGQPCLDGHCDNDVIP